MKIGIFCLLIGLSIQLHAESKEFRVYEDKISVSLVIHEKMDDFDIYMEYLEILTTSDKTLIIDADFFMNTINVTNLIIKGSILDKKLTIINADNIKKEKFKKILNFKIHDLNKKLSFQERYNQENQIYYNSGKLIFINKVKSNIIAHIINNNGGIYNHERINK
jgi:hypothetical protein